MIKTRRYKRLVFGFVFCTWNWYDFWGRSWGLPCTTVRRLLWWPAPHCTPLQAVCTHGVMDCNPVQQHPLAETGDDVWVAMLTSGLKRRPLSCYTSGSFRYWTIFFVLDVTQFLCLCTMFHELPQWIISLHVFGDDTVANVTVSKANLCECSRWALSRSLLLRCFDLRWNANLAGDLRIACGLWWFCSFFVGVRLMMICLFSLRTTRVLAQDIFSLLTQL